MYRDAVFDTTCTFNSRIFELQDHLDRFFNSLKYLPHGAGPEKTGVCEPHDTGARGVKGGATMDHRGGEKLSLSQKSNAAQNRPLWIPAFAGMPRLYAVLRTNISYQSLKSS